MSLVEIKLLKIFTPKKGKACIREHVDLSYSFFYGLSTHINHQTTSNFNKPFLWGVFRAQEKIPSPLNKGFLDRFIIVTLSEKKQYVVLFTVGESREMLYT